MAKKKLLVVSDAAVAPTGFGNVAAEVLDRLHATGRWEIKQLGVNYRDEDHDKPYRIFNPRQKDPRDWLGFTRLKELYHQIKPDVVWLFQDFWNINEYIAHSPYMTGLVTYFPVDGKHLKPSYLINLASAVHVCTYTKFAAEETAKTYDKIFKDMVGKAVEEDKEILKLIQVNFNKTSQQGINLSVKKVQELADPDNIHIIPHGVDPDKFYPVDSLDYRLELGIPPDAFVVGNFNRNQHRKRLDLTVKAFAKFAEDKPEVRLLFHDALKTQEGWDLHDLADAYGVKDKVLISQRFLSLEDLNKLHNVVDVMINTAGGEGWGLNSFNSAACGKPQVVPNWSATREIWADSALFIDPVETYNEIGRINSQQAVLSTDHAAEQLNRLYEDEELRESLGQKCKEVTQRPEYDWDVITEQFEEIFNDAAETEYVPVEELEIKDVS